MNGPDHVLLCLRQHATDLESADAAPPLIDHHLDDHRITSLRCRVLRFWFRRDKGKNEWVRRLSFRGRQRELVSAHRALLALPKALAQDPLEDLAGPAFRQLGVRELDPPAPERYG